jgi:hypothetical protein
MTALLAWYVHPTGESTPPGAVGVGQHAWIIDRGALWTLLRVLLYFPGFKYRDRTAARGDSELRSGIFPLGKETAS